jgi:catechol 2,3-dioxygenase-like lactoylglutathione lyase family enzyme
MRLAQARIVTHDVPRLTRFYEAVTGLRPQGDDRYVEFHASGPTLAISSQRMIELYGANAAEPSANRSVILDFEVEDVDRERARLDGLIGDFVLEPTTQPWGNRAMMFRDPDGNLINMFTDRRIEEKA